MSKSGYNNIDIPILKSLKNQVRNYANFHKKSTNKKDTLNSKH